MCGVRLAELTSRLGRAPSLGEWRNELLVAPISKEFSLTTLGLRVRKLLRDPACRAVAEYLLDQPSGPVELPSVHGPTAEYMAVAGLLRREGARSWWACDVIEAIANAELPLRDVLSPIWLPIEDDSIDVAALVEQSLPFLQRALVRDPEAIRTENRADRKGAVPGVYARQLQRVIAALVRMHPVRVHYERQPKLTSIGRIDIVLTCRVSDAFAKPIVILVGANLDLVNSDRKDTLQYRIMEQAVPCLAALDGKEAWVINFTTEPPAKFDGAAYPFGPCVDSVRVMHIFHDADWTRAEIFVSDGTRASVDLTPSE